MVHLTTLWTGLNLVGLSFRASEIVATLVAITSNFFLHNQFTYRDRRLRGCRLVRGLSIFYLVCGFGVVANVGIASYAFSANYVWWLAGVAGAVIGSVFNFAMSSVFTWNRR